MPAHRRARPAYDLVIIGLGSAGLTAAEFASKLGLRVAAVESGRVGGECLWTGCVPSKALLAAAHTAHGMRTASRFGLPAFDPEIDLRAVWQGVREARGRIAQGDDSADHVRAMGVEYFPGRAVLEAPDRVDVDGRILHTRYVLVCTGSRPAVPDIAGLADTGFLTPDTLFDLTEPPSSVVCIGGGPVGTEMAQAFTRLGITTTLLQRADRILPRDEPELTVRLERCLRSDGATVRTGSEVTRVSVDESGGRVVTARMGTREERWSADAVFVATGRAPNVEGLGLEGLGVSVGPRGVNVDGTGRTPVPNVFGAGDVTGNNLFTHAATYAAAAAVRTMFLPGSARREMLVPWCTFTDPELAHVGLTSDQARRRFGRGVAIRDQELVHNDRAVTSRSTDGIVRIVTRRGRIVGVHILAPGAGELIHEPALAMSRELHLGALTGFAHVYPTLSASIGRIGADGAYRRAARLGFWARRG